MSGTRELAETLYRIEQTVLGHATTPQTPSTSVVGGELEFKDDDGNLLSTLGSDGGFTYVSLPTPPRPTAPVVASDANIISVVWDGNWDYLEVADEGGEAVSVAEGDSLDPVGVDVLEIHVGAADGFELDPTLTLKGTIPPVATGTATMAGPFEEAGDYFVCLVARSKTGEYGEASEYAPVHVPIGSVADELMGTWLKADEAMVTADGKSNVFYGEDPSVFEPEDGFREGDLWFDTSVNPETGAPKNEPKIFSEETGGFVSVRDSRLKELADLIENFDVETPLSEARAQWLEDAATAAQAKADAAQQAALDAAKAYADSVSAGLSPEVLEALKKDAQDKADAAQQAAISAATSAARDLANQARDEATAAANSRFPIKEVDISNGAVTADKVSAGAIGADAIAANAVDAGKIKAGSIGTDKLGAKAVTAEKIATGTITAESGIIGSLDLGKATVGELDGKMIKANTIVSEKIAAGAVRAVTLAGDAVDGKVITGATVRTAASGARVQMDLLGFHAWDKDNKKTFDVDGSTGAVSIVGNLFSGVAGASRVAIDAELYPSPYKIVIDGVERAATGAGIRLGLDQSPTQKYAELLYTYSIGTWYEEVDGKIVKREAPSGTLMTLTGPRNDDLPENAQNGYLSLFGNGTARFGGAWGRVRLQGDEASLSADYPEGSYRLMFKPAEKLGTKSGDKEGVAILGTPGDGFLRIQDFTSTRFGGGRFGSYSTTQVMAGLAGLSLESSNGRICLFNNYGNVTDVTVNNNTSGLEVTSNVLNLYFSGKPAIALTSGKVGITGETAITGPLSVSGDSTVSGALAVANGASITGDTTITGNVAATGTGQHSLASSSANLGNFNYTGTGANWGFRYYNGSSWCGEIGSPGGMKNATDFGIASSNRSLELVTPTGTTHGHILKNHLTQTGGSANVNMDADGVVRRITSSRGTKLNERPMLEEIDGLADKLLSVPAKMWHDKEAIEAYARSLDGQDGIVPDRVFDRVPGVVAEDVADAGLPQFVNYDRDGEVMGVMYDRLACALIPIVRQQRGDIADLRAEVEALKAAVAA